MTKRTRKKRNSYALYKGDELLMVGTSNEIAEYLGVKVQRVFKIATKSYQKEKLNNKDAYVAYKIEEDENDQQR